MLNEWFAGALPLGMKAPAFELPDQDGRAHSLAALAGQSVILIFYPGDHTPLCRAQMCEFRDEFEVVRSKGAVVFGINRQSAESHAGFKKRNALPFPLLVDATGAVCKAYGTKGLLVKRTVYAIDREGVICFAQRGKPALREVMSALV